MIKFIVLGACCLGCLACNNRPNTSPKIKQENSTIASGAIDLSSTKALNALIKDSTEFIDQDQASELKHYTLCYDASGKISKAYLTTESVSGDAASSKTLYFDENGHTQLAHYTANVIPEDFELDIWAVFSKGALQKIQWSSSNKKLKISNQTELEKLVPRLILSGPELKKEMISAVKKADYIESMEESFEVEGGPMPGTESSSYEDLGFKRVYNFPDIQVGERTGHIEGSEIEGKEVFINKKGRDPIFLPAYRPQASFVGKYKKYLFIEYGEGLLREIHIYDLNKERFVYDSPYVLSKIDKGYLIMVRKMRASSEHWLPACEKEKASGDGFEYQEVIKVDLNTFIESPTGQVVCAYTQ